MRKIKISVIIVVVLMLITASTSWAQRYPRSRMMYFNGLDLTEEQINMIQEKRLDFQKEILELRTQLQGQYLELRSLNLKGEPQEKIDDKISQIEKLSLELEQKYLAHRDQIRELLTDEQKAMFDRWGGLGLGLGRMDGMGLGLGYGRGIGRGFDRGWGRGFGAGRGWNRNPRMGRGMGFRCPMFYQRGMNRLNRFRNRF